MGSCAYAAARRIFSRDPSGDPQNREFWQNELEKRIAVLRDELAIAEALLARIFDPAFAERQQLRRDELRHLLRRPPAPGHELPDIGDELPERNS